MICKKINLIFLTGIIAILSGCNVLSTNTSKEPAKSIALKLNPGENNPRNSEGDFITLKDGKILFIYSHFSGNSGSDFGNGYLASRYSTDKGKTWSTEDQLVVKQEGISNSPLSPASIARVPSTGDLLLVWNSNGQDQKRTPFNIGISKDEGKGWSHIKTLEADPDGWYCYTAIHFTNKDVLS